MESEKEILNEEEIAEEIAGEYILKYFKMFLVITICTTLIDIMYIFLGDVDYSIGANMIIQMAKFGTYITVLFYLYEQYRTNLRATLLAASMGGMAILHILSLVYYMNGNTIFWNMFPQNESIPINIFSIITYFVVFLGAITGALWLNRVAVWLLFAQVAVNLIVVEDCFEGFSWVQGDGFYLISNILTGAWYLALAWMLGDSRKELQDMLELEE